VNLLFAVLLAGLPAGGPAQITVRVADLASVPDKLLSHAEDVAGNVLEQAGIGVRWLRCPEQPECTPEPAGAEFPVLILDLRPRRHDVDTTGFAVIPAEGGKRYAGVFLPMVRDAAGSLDADEVVLLGATIAHEIGHLLLGARAHTATGIMSPRFGQEHVHQAERGELRFTAEQAAVMRSVARRGR
jgi:hypothetical protein